MRKSIKRGESNEISHKMALSMLVLALSIMFVTSASAGIMTAGNGAVYMETNNVTDNRIISFDRSADGSLSISGSFSTDGLGT